MAFKIRRGTNAERLTITPAQGELIYTTDTKKLYVGDGTTVGGTAIDTELPIALVDDKVVMTPVDGVDIGSFVNEDYGTLRINAHISSPINMLGIIQRHETPDANNIHLYRSRGTFENPLPVQQNDEIIDIIFGSRGQNANLISALLTAKVEGPVSANVNPGCLDFYTTSSTGALTLATKIDSTATLRANKISSVTTNVDLEISRNGTGRLKLNGMNFPNTYGSNGDLLTTNGSGELEWSNPPNLTGYATTNYVDTSITGLASETYVDNKVSDLVNGATSTLDTLKELAEALGNDQNFATTIANSLANKANVVDLSAVATSGDYADLLNVPFTPNLLNVGTNILPSTDVTYDLGSPSKRFRDLYLSGSTIDLGGKTLSITGNTLGIGGNKFGESGNVVGVAITQLYNNTVYIRLDVGSAAETIANNIIAGDILKLDPAVDLITQLTVVSNNGGIVDTNNTAFKDYELTVAETGPSNAVNIFFELVKPIATDVKQLQDSEGLLDRTSISSGPTAPGSAAVANNNDVSINFSDAVGTKFKFNRNGKIDFPAAQYGSSVSTMFAEYGFRFRPTWNLTGTGPELAISWNDGIELSPISNDHYTVGNNATPFFITGTYTDQAGKLPGDVYIDGGRNGPANLNGIVNIGRGYTSQLNIGQSGTATTITFNDGSSITSANYRWQFRQDGTMNYPGGITHGFKDATSCPANDATVIYTSNQTYRHALRLFVMVEGIADGDSQWSTQACDIIVAKGYNNTVTSSVFGLVHTSTNPLATFNAVWNVATERINVTCTPVSTTNSLVSCVHSIELESND